MSTPSPRAEGKILFDTPVAVRVPGSIGNLGPGFDSFGLALGIYDDVEVTARREPGLHIEVRGQGANDVPRTEEHLVAQAMLVTLGVLGLDEIGLEVHCRNSIPHKMGLGSSGAAIAAGINAAVALCLDPHAMDDATKTDIAAALERHPDNVCASLRGGLCLGWHESTGWRAERVEPVSELRVVVCSPDEGTSTTSARQVLPATAAMKTVVHAISHAGLLMLALSQRPDLLWNATEDRVHQPHRYELMPESGAVIEQLRSERLAAVLSGAGPSVAVLGADDDLEDQVNEVLEASDCGRGWHIRQIPVDRSGVIRLDPERW